MDIEKQFKAFIVKEENGKFISEIVKKNISELPDNEVLINVKYSSLNYKDALSASGNKGITKTFPHTPGIDAAGIVEKSKNDSFREGDKVIVTGFDLGMNTPGGFGQYILVPANWVIKLPENLSLKESMILGTAGFTAALSIYQLEKMGLKPESGEVLVTGASGGVGSLAVALLSKANYSVIASTGKQDKKDFLSKLGAKEIISREEMDEDTVKPLLTSKFSGAVDVVGGNTLSNVLRKTKYGGSVAACGLTQSNSLNITVYPFILRGINLLGIDSVHCDLETRKILWKKLSGDWKIDQLENITEEIYLEQLREKIELILKGKISGRVLINLE